MRTFRYAGSTRAALSVAGSEHLGLPEVFPQMDNVDVYMGWFGRWIDLSRQPPPPRAAAVVGEGTICGGAAVRPTPRIAPQAAAGDGRSLVIAVARDEFGQPLATTALTGPDPYETTASLLAWGAVRAATPSMTSAPAYTDLSRPSGSTPSPRRHRIRTTRSRRVLNRAPVRGESNPTAIRQGSPWARRV